MIGKTIGFAAALLLTGSLAAQPQPPSAASEPEEASSDADTIHIEFDVDRYERMTVPVTIAGKGPYRFFVDTGAQATVVTPRISSDLSLRPSGKATLVGLGSTRVVDTIDIDRLEFADRTLSGLRSPMLARQNIGADGILGLDSLQDTRVLIDFTEDRLSVADAGDLGGNRGYEIVVRARSRLGQMIITDARINGVKTAVIIDTGAQNSIANGRLLKLLRSRKQEDFSTIDVNGTSVSGELFFARSLKIGKMEMTQVPIGFHDSPAFAALGLEDQPAVILGMRNLRLFDRVAIDFASRKILFDLPSDAFRNPYPAVPGQFRS